MERAELQGQVEFPTLSTGITVLETEDRAAGAFHSLVLDHLLLSEGTAVWVDARNNAVTTHLSKLASSRRTLRRISVARGFTPFQHYSIVEDLARELTSQTQLVALPALDWFYAQDELHVGEGTAMLESVMDHIETLVDQYDVSVLMSLTGGLGLDSLVLDRADERLKCELTEFGPRFSGDEFETLVFECGENWIQTTLAFWARVLQARHPVLESEHPTEVTPVGSH
jgi:hypothetical protein